MCICVCERRLCRLNTIYITISQNTTQSIVLWCTVCFTTTCSGPLLQAIFRLRTLGLESNVSCIQIYYIDDEISVIIIQLQSHYGGVQVDYCGRALALGVGWQGWNNICILLLCNCSLEWLSLCCTMQYICIQDTLLSRPSVHNLKMA